MERALCIALSLLAAALLFGFGYVIGAGRGVDLIRQQAVDEGYAVRDPHFRWRSGDELERRPARAKPSR